MKQVLLLAFLALFLFCAPTAEAKDKVLNIEVIKSKGGIEAWLVQDTTVPVISVSFSFEGGLAYDPDDKPGVGRLVSILLDEGAGEMSSQEFQSKLSDNAIDLGFTAGRDAFYGEMKTLKDKKDLAFQLLNLALTKPSFDSAAITRMKNANTSQIRKDIGDPSWLSARTFNGMLFEGHFYSRPGYGTLASMGRITRKDLVNFTKSQFVRSGLRVSIAGDITKAEAESMLDAVFGSLPEKSDLPNSPAAELKNVGKTILLPLDTPQTYIVAGAQGITRDDKDWHAAVIMNYVLGGGSFDSRLMKEIREKRGLTYGIYSSLGDMKHAAVMQMNTSVSNENVKETLDLMKSEMARMSKEGVTDRELKNAKAYLTGSLLLELTSTDDISNVMNGLQRDGKDPEYINERNSLIESVSVSDIRRVAERLLKSDALTVVMVGKPVDVTPDILLDKPPGMEMSR
jgi:zinc protease